MSKIVSVQYHMKCVQDIDNMLLELRAEVSSSITTILRLSKQRSTTDNCRTESKVIESDLHHINLLVIKRQQHAGHLRHLILGH